MTMSTINSPKRVLVTGGSGFVAIHCIAQLLQQGYQVRTTLRLIDKKQEVLNMLQTAGTSAGGLQFIEADLTHDLNWQQSR